MQGWFVQCFVETDGRRPWTAVFMTFDLQLTAFHSKCMWNLVNFRRVLRSFLDKMKRVKFQGIDLTLETLVHLPLRPRHFIKNPLSATVDWRVKPTLVLLSLISPRKNTMKYRKECRMQLFWLLLWFPEVEKCRQWKLEEELTKKDDFFSSKNTLGVLSTDTFGVLSQGCAKLNKNTVFEKKVGCFID